MISDEDVLDVDVEMVLYRRQNGLRSGLFHSIHDISDGGVLCDLAECCFGNMMGSNNVTGDSTYAVSEGGQFVVLYPRNGGLN